MKIIRRKAKGERRKGFVHRGNSSFLLPTSYCALCATLASTPAFGQGLADPTRPPPGFGAGDAQATAAAGGPVLQSVMISASGSAAIISGEMVKVGQKYGDAVLVKVAESEVVLKSTSGTQVLKLYPGVDKRSSKQQAVKTPARVKRAPSDPSSGPGTPGQGGS